LVDEPDRDDRTGAYLGLLDREAAPGLARVAAGAWLRTGAWTAQTAVKATRRIARAARSGESAAALVDDARREVASTGRRLLGIADPSPDEARKRDPADYDDQGLHQRWAELIDLSTEIDVEVDGHPAFAGILSQLHPDEARILRLLAVEGPQAAVDVRNWRPLGIGSHVVAPGLNMIGQHAGCLMVERVPVYLSNLFRLGLIWFSRDPVDEISPYQVLEAQPEVKAALKSAGHGTTVRRSVRLTPFGAQFCAATLPEGTAQLDALDRGQAPRPIDEVPPPTEDPEASVS
jgi:Abortive infection alpha